MDTEKGNRLRLLRVRLNLSQQFIADVLGINQGGVSKREKGLLGVSYEDAQKLSEHPQIKVNVDWLLTGEGLMLTNQLLVEEENVPYAVTYITDTTEYAITKRFVARCEEYKRLHTLTGRDIAAKLNISDSHYSQLKEGTKYVTPVMLGNAVLYLSIDANFIVAGRELVINKDKAGE